MPDELSGQALLQRQASAFRALHVLATMMAESADEQDILQMAVSSIPSFCQCDMLAVCLGGAWRSAAGLTPPEDRAGLEGQIEQLGADGGRVSVPGQRWAWAYPLTDIAEVGGHLVAATSAEPLEHEQFLLSSLGHQLGASLANAQRHERERAGAEGLQMSNDALERSMTELRHTLDIHDRLTGAAAAGEGRDGIAGAVHELTGHPVAIEDPYGNLTTWVGAGRPDPYPKDTPGHRAALVDRIMTAGHPVREDGRLVAVARTGEEAMGVIALVDPNMTAVAADHVALERGATVLAIELGHLRDLAEAELRRRRDLVDELLIGTDADSAMERALALGYDLGRPHRVVVIERGHDGLGQEEFFHAVRRAARDTGAGSLLASRGGAVVVLADHVVDWTGLRDTVARGSGVACRIGIGGSCGDVKDFRRSFREAQLALRLQHAVAGGEPVTVFDDLGVYRLLADVRDAGMVEAFARRWLGPLLDYDDAKGSQLVETLSEYLEAGGSYETATLQLSVHRSTLRYRLQRLRDLSGHDLGDPDTRFNLQLATRAWHTLEAMRGVEQ